MKREQRRWGINNFEGRSPNRTKHEEECADQPTSSKGHFLVTFSQHLKRIVLLWGIPVDSILEDCVLRRTLSMRLSWYERRGSQHEGIPVWISLWCVQIDGLEVGGSLGTFFMTWMHSLTPETVSPVVHVLDIWEGLIPQGDKKREES